jgi:uncharacterized repeat protein (TIGR03803 family)
MNYARQQDKSFRMIAPFVAAMLALTLAVAAIPARAQTYKILENFLTGGPGPQWPGGPLAQGRDGHLYGFSFFGGANNTGSIWKATPSGKVSVVLSFATGAGEDCQAGMTLGTDGNFYGSADTNCAGDGYVFKLTPSGTLTVLHTFTGTPDGSGPGPLIQYTDGNFYGITTNGGANNYGSVFKITPAGKLTILYSFPQANPYPTYGLTVGNDGNFYGTTGSSGVYNGAVFKITPAGVLTVLYTFTGEPDGSAPQSGVILGNDGNFYGTTEFGGISDSYSGFGTIFKITPSGKETILYSFSSTDYAAHPIKPLIQATDGNFYGVNNGCAEFSCFNPEDMFKITPSGTLTVLEKFTGSNGVLVDCPLTQDTNGILYGLTQQGGTVNGGVLFTENIGAEPFINLVSTSGKVGSKVGILGQGFSSSSVVKFNGVTATTVTRSGATFLLATVPAGASDGKVTVTTGSTALTSPQTFIVHNSWSSGAVLPTALQGPATGVLHGKVYVVGGATNSGSVAINQIYNPATNKWTTGASMPTPRFSTASGVLDNILYVIGGSTDGVTPLSVVEAYDAASNTWSTKASLPTATASPSAAVENGIIYVVGGYSNGARTAAVESYNPVTDTWTAEAPLAVAKSLPAVGLLGSTIVAAGGLANSGETGDNEGYSATKNSWSSLTADPTARQAGCAASVSGRLYFAGGTNGTPLKVVESFSATANKWTTLLRMPQAVVAPGGAEVNGLLYCFGGSNNGTIREGTVYNYLQIYQP